MRMITRTYLLLTALLALALVAFSGCHDKEPQVGKAAQKGAAGASQQTVAERLAELENKVRWMSDGQTVSLVSTEDGAVKLSAPRVGSEVGGVWAITARHYSFQAVNGTIDILCDGDDRILSINPEPGRLATEPEFQPRGTPEDDLDSMWGSKEGKRLKWELTRPGAAPPPS